MFRLDKLKATFQTAQAAVTEGVKEFRQATLEGVSELRAHNGHPNGGPEFDVASGWVHEQDEDMLHRIGSGIIHEDEDTLLIKERLSLPPLVTKQHLSDSNLHAKQQPIAPVIDVEQQPVVDVVADGTATQAVGPPSYNIPAAHSNSTGRTESDAVALIHNHSLQQQPDHIFIELPLPPMSTPASMDGQPPLSETTAGFLPHARLSLPGTNGPVPFLTQSKSTGRRRSNPGVPTRSASSNGIGKHSIPFVVQQPLVQIPTKDSLPSSAQHNMLTTQLTTNTSPAKQQSCAIQQVGPNHGNGPPSHSTPVEGIVNHVPTMQQDNDGNMREAYAEMQAAYHDAKALLKKSMDECMRLSGLVVELQHQVTKSNESASQQAAAAKAAATAAAELAAQLSVAKKEVAASQKAAESAARQLQDMQAQQAKEGTIAELETLRSELAAAVRQAMAAVEARETAEARAAEAQAAREAAEAARLEAEELRREAEAQAQAAVAAAESERSTRAEAVGATEVLRADQERRARTFNDAVRAAVAKVQQELEAERCSLQEQLQDAQVTIADLTAQLKDAVAAAQEASTRAEYHEQAAIKAGERQAQAEAAAERAAAREAEAISNAHAAVAAKQAVSKQSETVQQELNKYKESCSHLESRASQLEHQLQQEQSTAATAIQVLEGELSHLRERVETLQRSLSTAEKQLESYTATSPDTSRQADATISLLQSRVFELENELQKARSATAVNSFFQLPTKQEVLAGLGLEVDGRLKWKVEDPDLEIAPMFGSSSSYNTKASPVSRVHSVVGSSASKVLGVVPLRIILLVAYLTVLHITVMISFTRTTDLNKLCAGFHGHAGFEHVFP